MTIYEFLLKYVNRRAANALIFMWYLFLLLSIFYFLGIEQGEFRYDDY